MPTELTPAEVSARLSKPKKPKVEPVAEIAPVVETPEPEPIPAPTPEPESGPESWDSPEIADLQLNWPQAETMRELGVPLSKEELGKAAHELVDTIIRIRELEDEKKSAADRIKGLIGDQETKQNRLTVLIDRGTDEKDVPCVWVFGIRGRDDAGKFIRDGNMKTLVRKDSGDVVEVRAVTDSDRQMCLPIPEEPEEPTGTLVDAADDPYMQGRVARAKGEGVEKCPYDTEGDEAKQHYDRQDWLEGWREEPVLVLDSAEDAETPAQEGGEA